MDTDMARGEDRGVNSSGLAINLPRVLHNVYVHGQLQTWDEVFDSGQGYAAGVAEELPGLVA